MARIISIHELEVPEDQRAEFEKFFRDDFCRFQGLEGWHYSLLKGQRGDRTGKYAVLIEFDRPEDNYRYFPVENQGSKEFEQVVATHSEFYAKLNKLITPAQREFTLYEVQVEAEKLAA